MRLTTLIITSLWLACAIGCGRGDPLPTPPLDHKPTPPEAEPPYTPRVAVPPLAEQRQPERPVPPVVTKAEYDALKLGMSYREVCEVIGDPGEQSSHDEFGPGRTVSSYRWHNADGSHMHAVFADDKLASKGQSDLR